MSDNNALRLMCEGILINHMDRGQYPHVEGFITLFDLDSGRRELQRTRP